MTALRSATAAVAALVATCASCGTKTTAPLDDGGALDAPTAGGCAPADYVDGTSLIQFGGEGGSPLFMYSPRCLSVARGTTVRFAGDFSLHPLSPGVAPGDDPGDNPIPRTAVGHAIDVPFGNAGAFPYFCELHYAAGMRGTVRVLP